MALSVILLSAPIISDIMGCHCSDSHKRFSRLQGVGIWLSQKIGSLIFFKGGSSGKIIPALAQSAFYVSSGK
jgi:hypothetical protein